MIQRSVGSVLDQLASGYANELALVDHVRRQTFSEAIGEMRSFGRALRGQGLEPGDRVALLMSDRREFMIAYYGAMWAGLVTVAFHPKLGLEPHVQIFKNAAPRAVVFDDETADRVTAILNEVDVPLKISVDRASVPGDGRHFDSLVAGADPGPGAPAVDLESPCFVVYTGGTTGWPKGVVHNHRTLLAALTMMPLEYELGSRERFAHVMPLSHAGGLLFFPVWLRGGTNFILGKFDPEALLATIERERITSLILVPTMIYVLLDRSDIRKRDLASLGTVVYGAAPIGAERLHEALDVFGPVFNQMYGQAEAPGLITTLAKADHVQALQGVDPEVFRSCGRPCLIADVALLDDNLQPVREGEAGEVCLKGPHVMRGYHENPDETELSLRGGWLCTGDIGRRDERGLYYLMDRKKDMIVSGGYNVYPKQVEQTLFAHPAVADACVIGVPDEKWGEAVKAVVIRAEGTDVDRDSLIAFARDRAGSLLAPKSIDFVDAIPTTPIGKHDKKALRAEYWAARERAIG